jgi:hypothetical protein
MSVKIWTIAGQNWEAIVATAALVVSLTSLWKDKRSRQLDMLHDIFRKIGEKNAQITDYNPDDRSDKQVAEDTEIMIEEKLKEYEYLCFLINRKETYERYVYQLGHEDMEKVYYEDFEGDINENDYPEFIKVMERWEDYPPKSIVNRAISWLKRTPS